VRCLTVITFVSLVLGFSSVNGSANDKPNVILVVSDDAGFSDIGAFGSEIETPNLDRLAYEGIRFSQFYSNARCSPTRASLLTGKYPHSVGVGGLANLSIRTELPGYLGYLNPENNETLAEILSANGYATIMSGKWHLGGYLLWEEPLRSSTSPNGRGFDSFFGLLHGQARYKKPDRYLINNQKYEHDTQNSFYATDAFVQFAIKFIDETRQDETSAPPFFLYLPFTAPHVPLEAPQDLIDKYKSLYKGADQDDVWQRLRRERYNNAISKGVIDRNTPFRDDPASSRTLAKTMEELPIHAAMIEKLDENVGFLLEYLSDIGELENSIIIYMSDNGGRGAYGPIGNSPFYGRKTDLWEGGMRTHFIFWSPMHVKEPGGVVNDPAHAIDVMPTILELLQINPTSNIDGQSFVPVLADAEWQNNRTLFWELYGAEAVRKKNWKYLRDKDGKEYLFDIDKDPTETQNLFQEFPNIATDLKQLYADWAPRQGVLPNSVVEEAQAEFNQRN